jgi:hypothetical protein
MTPKSYLIRLSEDLYLDCNNNFLTSALPNSPVYVLAGSDLPHGTRPIATALSPKPSKLALNREEEE